MIGLETSLVLVQSFSRHSWSLQGDVWIHLLKYFIPNETYDEQQRLISARDRLYRAQRTGVFRFNTMGAGNHDLQGVLPFKP